MQSDFLAMETYLPRLKQLFLIFYAKFIHIFELVL